MEKSGDGFVDRGRLRILLCDNDEKSSEEVFTLLCKCSYQVTSVKSPRQVIDALNAEGPGIDIILSEVDLPMSKGFKMLKYIMRDKELCRVHVIMMSAQDEVSIVVKCLKFGAADYLVKSLRTNELLNLCTHMWRRRRMLGLAEKNIVNYDFDSLVSDPSDANTNSTTLFSDDKSRKTTIPEPEMCVSNHQENENIATAFAVSIETVAGDPSECQPDMPGQSYRQREIFVEQILPFPKKSDLKIGESSAFFTYVKSSTLNLGSSSVGTAPQHEEIAEKLDTGGLNVRDIQENHHQSDECPRSNTPQISNSLEISQQRHPNGQYSQVHLHLRNESSSDASSCYPHTAYPLYMPAVMNQATMQSASMYHKNMPDMLNPANSGIMTQYNHHIPQCPPQIPGMASYYPYCPFGLCLQPGQMPVPHPPWPSFGNASSNDGPLSKIDRREAALMKFRQKRKERCFDKKIRYVNRKKLAECRPRLRGQFVRKVNGVNVDLNEEEEDEDYNDLDDQSSYSPEDDTSACLQ